MGEEIHKLGRWGKHSKTYSVAYHLHCTDLTVLTTLIVTNLAVVVVAVAVAVVAIASVVFAAD